MGLLPTVLLLLSTLFCSIASAGTGSAEISSTSGLPYASSGTPPTADAESAASYPDHLADNLLLAEEGRQQQRRRLSAVTDPYQARALPAPRQPFYALPRAVCTTIFNRGVCSAGTSCMNDTYDPYFPTCAPCAQVCASCTGGILRLDTITCQVCACPAFQRCLPTAASSGCSAGSFCQSSTSTCGSCYNCIDDTDVRGFSAEIASCQAACGFAARRQWPTYGLPAYNETITDPTANNNWLVDNLLAASALFATAQMTNLDSADKLLSLLPAANLAHITQPAQAQYLYSQLLRDGASRVTPEDWVRVFSTVEDQYHVFCPPDHVIFKTRVSFPGCTCVSIPTDYQLDYTNVAGTERSWLDALAPVPRQAVIADCPVGYRCSAHSHQALSHILYRRSVAPTMGICTPCLIGEYCQPGSIELSTSLVKKCTTQSALVLSGGQSSNADGNSSSSDVSCSNFNMCPAGSYCPDPTQQVNCTAGNFCGFGSTNPITCDFNDILTNSPFASVKPSSVLVLDYVTSTGSALQGNICPAGSKDPYTYCDAGYYCPNQTTKLLCPKGHFCPAFSTQYHACPILSDCSREGVDIPKTAAWGWIVLILIILTVPAGVMAYKTFMHATQIEQQSEDRMLEFLTSLGFTNMDEDDVAADAEMTRLAHEQKRGVYCCGLITWRSKPKKEQTNNGDLLLAGVEFSTTTPKRDKLTKAQSRNIEDRNHSPLDTLQTDVEACDADGSLDTAGLSKTGALGLSRHGGAMAKLPPGFGAIMPTISISFEGLTLMLKSNGKPKLVLNDVSGDFPHGKMHALMGPSGCGKSSFMTALCGKANYGITEGIVTMWQGPGVGEGTPCSFDDVRYLTGFVPQEDLVHEVLTVRENLMFAARLRLPTNIHRREREGVVRSICSLLGLMHIQNSIVGGVEQRGISGGQRKRVNIGMELVAKPSVLFLDEPTSGLDSAVSQDILSSLKRLGAAGMNVIMVIHQPRYSIFEMFDSVLLLGEGGRTTYFGPVIYAMEYFNFLGFSVPANENPADFYLDVISGAMPRQGDEDFVPKELFTVWEEFGYDWLEEKQGKYTESGSMTPNNAYAVPSYMAQQGDGQVKVGGDVLLLASADEAGQLNQIAAQHSGGAAGTAAASAAAQALPSQQGMAADTATVDAEKLVAAAAVKMEIEAAGASEAGSARVAGGSTRSAAGLALDPGSPSKPADSVRPNPEEATATVGKPKLGRGTSRRGPIIGDIMDNVRKVQAQGRASGDGVDKENEDEDEDEEELGEEVYEEDDAAENAYTTALDNQYMALRALTGNRSPWRPKDLQAIHDNFDLLDKDGNHTLDHTEFMKFWNSMKRLLPEHKFRQFLEESVQQFNLAEDSVISRSDFLHGIKVKLLMANLTPAQRAALPQLGAPDQERCSLVDRLLHKVSRKKKRKGIVKTALSHIASKITETAAVPAASIASRHELATPFNTGTPSGFRTPSHLGPSPGGGDGTPVAPRSPRGSTPSANNASAPTSHVLKSGGSVILLKGSPHILGHAGSSGLSGASSLKIDRSAQSVNLVNDGLHRHGPGHGPAHPNPNVHRPHRERRMSAQPVSGHHPSRTSPQAMQASMGAGHGVESSHGSVTPIHDPNDDGAPPTLHTNRSADAPAQPQQHQQQHAMSHLRPPSTAAPDRAASGANTLSNATSAFLNTQVGSTGGNVRSSPQVHLPPAPPAPPAPAPPPTIPSSQTDHQASSPMRGTGITVLPPAPLGVNPGSPHSPHFTNVSNSAIPAVGGNMGNNESPFVSGSAAIASAGSTNGGGFASTSASAVTNSGRMDSFGTLGNQVLNQAGSGHNTSGRLSPAPSSSMGPVASLRQTSGVSPKHSPRGSPRHTPGRGLDREDLRVDLQSARSTTERASMLSEVGVMRQVQLSQILLRDREERETGAAQEKAESRTASILAAATRLGSSFTGAGSFTTGSPIGRIGSITAALGGGRIGSMTNAARMVGLSGASVSGGGIVRKGSSTLRTVGVPADSGSKSGGGAHDESLLEPWAEGEGGLRNGGGGGGYIGDDYKEIHEEDGVYEDSLNSYMSRTWRDSIHDCSSGLGRMFRSGWAAVIGSARGGRAMPSLSKQCRIIFYRSIVKTLNERNMLLLDTFLMITLGLILGAVQGYTSDLTDIPANATIVSLAFCLAATVSGLRTFNHECTIFVLRESHGGLITAAYMWGRMLWDIVLICVYPAIFLGFYYAFTVFKTPFGFYYLILVFVGWFGFGVGYMFSTVLGPTNALLAGLVYTLIFGGIINGVSPGPAGASPFLFGLQYFSYTRWAVEGIFIGTSVPADPSLVFLTAGAMAKLGYCHMDDRFSNLNIDFNSLNSTQVNTLFSAVIGAQQGVETNTTDPQTKSLLYLYSLYTDPSQVEVACKNAYLTDLGWLFFWGVVFRIVAYIVLSRRVSLLGK